MVRKSIFEKHNWVAETPQNSTNDAKKLLKYNK